MRILHTMCCALAIWIARWISIPRYFGMKQLRRQDFPEGRFCSPSSVTRTRPTARYWSDPQLGHQRVRARHRLRPYRALAVEDACKACDEIRARGGKVVGGGTDEHGSTVIAFVEDPDGYRIELIQRAQFSQSSGRVRVIADLDSQRIGESVQLLRVLAAASSAAGPALAKQLDAVCRARAGIRVSAD